VFTIADHPVPQAPHSVGDILSDAVGIGDHHALAESCSLRWSINTAPEQRGLRLVTDRWLAGCVVYLRYLYESFDLITDSALFNGLVYGIKNKLMNMTYQNYRRKMMTKCEVNQDGPGRFRNARHTDRH